MFSFLSTSKSLEEKNIGVQGSSGREAEAQTGSREGTRSHGSHEWAESALLWAQQCQASTLAAIDPRSHGPHLWCPAEAKPLPTRPGLQAGLGRRFPQGGEGPRPSQDPPQGPVLPEPPLAKTVISLGSPAEHTSEWVASKLPEACGPSGSQEARVPGVRPGGRHKRQ